MLRLIYSLFIILSISLTLFLESPILAISAFLSILSLYIALGYLTKRPLATISKDVNRLSSKQYVFLNDSLGSYIDILLSGSQSHVIRGYRKIDYSLKRSEAFSLFYSLSPRVAIESIALFIIILAFPYITKTPALIPAFASFAIGSQKLLPAAQEIYASWAITRSLTYDMKELSINLTSPSSTSLTSPKKIDNTFSSIELHNVSLTSQGSIRLNPNSITIKEIMDCRCWAFWMWKNYSSYYSSWTQNHQKVPFLLMDPVSMVQSQTNLYHQSKTSFICTAEAIY